MNERQDLRLLGALIAVVGLGFGTVTLGAYVSWVGLVGGLASLVLLLRGRPAHLLPWAGAGLLAIALQALGSIPGLLFGVGAGLLLWIERARLLPSRLSRTRRLLLFGLGLVLVGLFLPWTATAGGFVAGYIQRLVPQTGALVSVYDPLANWVAAGREPGRQLLGSLLPLFAWSALLQIALGRPARLHRLGPPLWLILLAWWLLHRSILPGGLLYLSGTGLVGLTLIRSLEIRPKSAPGPLRTGQR